ncbi:MAG: hypothetical protein IPG42_02290 [Betaproteobacteria bacterium]|jgi:hypothetical protein|nr:hypothetical protein [Betaproteobacteria bacterium]MBP6646032.1 hypothetical protein [Burkholderiaceae bacterium]
MTPQNTTFMLAADLAALAQAASPDACSLCAPLACEGWESLPATFDQSVLIAAASLRNLQVDEPDLTEYHPNGTHTWSSDAPIAPTYFPYNLCTVWTCRQCARVFLRYTEYGGYYVDERIRAVNPALIC